MRAWGEIAELRVPPEFFYPSRAPSRDGPCVEADYGSGESLSYLFYGWLRSSRSLLRGLSGNDFRLGFLGFHFLLHLTSVTDEFLSRREFAEAMPDHLFRNENFQMLFTVVHSKCKSDHFRAHLTASRPRLNHSRSGGVQVLDLLQEFGVYEGSLFLRPTHDCN